MDAARPALTRLPRPAGLRVLVPAAFLGWFFVYPLARILARGISTDGFREVLTDADLLGVAWFTVWQAAASTVLTMGLALPAAYVFARYEFPGKAAGRALLTVPFVLPTVVVGSAFLALAGPGGALGVRWDESVGLILAAHVFYNFAVVVRTVGGLWSHLDPRLVEAARVLGASPWQAFRSVTLPLLRPALAAAASIVFLFSFTSFGVVLILGGARFATLEVEIYRQTTSFLDLGVAAALAVLQLAGVTAILLAYSRYQERRTVEQTLRPVAEAARPPRGWKEWLLVGGVLGSAGLALGAPLLVLVERSLRVGGGYGLGNYRALGSRGGRGGLFTSATEAIGNSLGFAVVATVLALVIGMLAASVVAYRRTRVSRWFDALLMLPLGTSAVTIGFGFLLALGWPVDLRTSWILVPIAHSLVAIPFVVRTVVPVMRSVRARLREAAAVLGAAPRQVWREIDLPMIARAGLVGAGFAFAISLGEFGATAFIARPDNPTLPIAIFRFLGLPGRFGQAMAMSVILMGVTAAAVLAIERFRVGHVGEF